jgi:RNA polymerase sigma-70 factor (ECF subfamily)
VTAFQIIAQPAESAAGTWQTPTSEQLFVAQLQARDSEAFTAVYERYKSQIYNYLLRLTAAAELADDLTHDTFLSAYEALPTLRDDSAISAWLYRIASNRFRDMLRRKRVINWMHLGDRKDAEQALSSSGGEEAIPEQELVQLAMHHIKPSYAVCLTLRLAEGFSTLETAEILGVSPESIRMRLCRARIMFKEAYAAAERGDLRS